MSPWLWVFVIAYALTRALSLIVSARHERALRSAGAVELDVRTTRALLGAITTYSLAALIAGVLQGTQLDRVSLSGIILVAASQLALLFVVRALGRLWTVRLLMASDHQHVRSMLLDRVRHPNYFLNLVPEWLGLGIAFHAWLVMAVGLPILFLLLIARIRHEEQALRVRFTGYRGLFIRS